MSDFEKTVFESGTRLVLVPMSGVESVATCVMVKAGSRYETPEINGISHFLEHMVFKGTKKFPTTEDVNFIERMGGIQNAYTDVDITNYHNKVLASDWQEALELNKELALHPRLDQQYVDKERDVILEEMKKYNDDLPAVVSEAFQHLLYPTSTLGMRVIGEEQSLRATNAQTLKSYHDRMYTPERMVVVVAGNIKNKKLNIKNTDQILKIKEQAKNWFGNRTSVLSSRLSATYLPARQGEAGLSDNGVPFAGQSVSETDKLEPEKQNSENRELKTDNKVVVQSVIDRQDKPAIAVVTKKDAQQAHLTIGLRTFARGSSDRFAWTVFNLLFGVSFTSRLFKEIREKRGLCYTVRSGSDAWDDAGYWSIYAGVATEKVTETVSAIMDELKKALDDGVTEDEVAIAKKRLLTMISFKTEDTEFMAEYYGQQELHHLPILTIEEYMKTIEGVTKQSIDALIEKYFIAKHLNLAIVWNRSKDENFFKFLKL